MDSFYKIYGIQKINDDMFLTIIGSFMAVANGISKLVAAAIIDKFSIRKLMLINIGIQVFLNLTITIIST